MTHAAQSEDSGSTRNRVGVAGWVLLGAATFALVWLLFRSVLRLHEPPPPHIPALWGLGTVPFVFVLTAIAVLPLIPFTAHWWENNRSRLIVSGTCAGLTLLFYALVDGAGAVPHVLDHAVTEEYVPFIVLLFGLYVITGGIRLWGDLPAHPLTNTLFLAVGAALASFVGTTGASMLLIRPLLQTNRERKRVVHTVVFFIFLVSNIGGTLLPIGDPPLFLGYLRGVPFTWTFVLWNEWVFCCGALLVIYFVWDSVAYRREEISSIQRDELLIEPLRLQGQLNLLWIAGVVAAVWQLVPGREISGTGFVVFPFMRELTILGLTGLSLALTPRGVRRANKFNYHAIIEVAVLFIGIFITMQVPLAVLQASGTQLGLDEGWIYFWATGALSSVLDNAPTYVVFFEAANALPDGGGPMLKLASGSDLVREDLLIGISLGAVFMGANTYIGNGPNFMVKSIAEQAGVKMPTFFGYVFRYALPVLVPVFVIMTLLFLM